jgi:O-antigen/teichoic acid export membrane protein
MTIRWPIPSHGVRAGAAFRQLRNSTVFWSWAFNFLRLATGLVLLPLLLHKLSSAELGMYYVLLSLVALAPVVDFGFNPTIVRFVSYAMGGAETIQAQGFARAETPGPNYKLLWRLFYTTRLLYRYLSLAVLVLAGAWGTYVVEMRIHETPFPNVARAAWAVALVAMSFDIYSGWAMIFLRGMNEVLPSVRIGVLSAVVKFVVGAGLLLVGAGLMSLPLASLVGSLLQQSLARRHCHKRLGDYPPPEKSHVWENLRVLWPNSWRLGVTAVCSCLTAQASTAICLKFLGLTSYAQYGLSCQLVGIISGMAMVWTQVKWQVVGQHRTRHDYAAMQRLLWPRFWLQNFTFLVLAAGLLICGPPLLRGFGGGKQMLPFGWLAWLAFYFFMELYLGFWTSLISTENRVPFLWHAVAASLISVSLSLILIHTTSLGIGALVLAPILAGSVCNYWYWPLISARSLRTHLFRFMFAGPQASPTPESSPV